MLTALSLGLLDALAAVLPRPWLYRLAEWAGVASVPFLDRQRQRSRNNLQRVRPDWNVEQLDAAVREVFRETARYYVDAAVFPRRTARQVLDADLEIEGLEHLTTAIENGGVVLASFHLSNPEVPIRALPALGLDATVLIEPLANRRQREALMRRRRSSGVEYVATGTEGVRRALDRLRSGGVVAVLVDRDIQLVFQHHE